MAVIGFEVLIIITVILAGLLYLAYRIMSKFRRSKVPAGQAVTKEREIITREVLIPCRSCGARHPQGTPKCLTCGANL